MSKVIPTDRHISYSQSFRKCGKPMCRICRESKGHGPYWYCYWYKDDGHLTGTYVGKTRPETGDRSHEG